jgi:DNA-directed RNA polymerase specialized sigma24 family protein
VPVDLETLDFARLDKAAWKIVHDNNRPMPSWVSREDLHVAAWEGICHAARSFDSTKGRNFYTYAYIRAFGAVADELRRVTEGSRGMQRAGLNLQRVELEDSHLAGCSTDDHDQVEIKAAIESLPSENHRRVAIMALHGADKAEMAAALGVTTFRVAELRREAAYFMGYRKHHPKYRRSDKPPNRLAA